MSEKSDKDTSSTSNEDNIISPSDILKEKDINIITNDTEKEKDNIINKIVIINKSQTQKDNPENINDNQYIKDIIKDNNINDINLNEQNQKDNKNNDDVNIDNSNNKEIKVNKKYDTKNNENKKNETDKINNDNQIEIKTKRFKRYFRYSVKTHIENSKILLDKEIYKKNDNSPALEIQNNNFKKNYSNKMVGNFYTCRNRSSINVIKTKNINNINSNNDNKKNSNNENINIKSIISKIEEKHINSGTFMNNSNHIRHNSSLANNSFYYSIYVKNNIKKSNNISNDGNNDNNKIRSNIIKNDCNNINNNIKNNNISNDGNNDNNKIRRSIIKNNSNNTNNNNIKSNNISNDGNNTNNNKIRSNIIKNDSNNTNNNIKSNNLTNDNNNIKNNIISNDNKYTSNNKIKSNNILNDSNNINNSIKNNIISIISNINNNKAKTNIISIDNNNTNNNIKTNNITNDSNNDNNKIKVNIIGKDNKNNNNNIIKSNIIEINSHNTNNDIKSNTIINDKDNDNKNINNHIITNDTNNININLKSKYNTDVSNNLKKINTIINDSNNFNNNNVVSINCKKITHHVSAKSIDAIIFNPINLNLDSNNNNILENKSNKGPYKTKRLKEMEKNILLGAPKKECNVCHKLIESYLFKIHVNNHPSQIFKWMYLGTFESACNASDLRKLGINYILNCAYDCNNTQLPKGITELHLKVRDESDFEIFEYFEKANAFINKVRSKGGIIFIHCKLGISRSPSFVLAYLIKYYNFSLQNALKFLRKRRPQVNPNEGFMNHLDKYEKLFKGKERKRINDINPNNK